MSTDNKTSTRLIVASALLASGIFLIDLLVPLGVAGGVPYVALVLLSLWSPNKRFTWGVAIVASALTVLGFLLSASGSIVWMVLVNRSLALFVIWVTAILCLARKRAEEKLRLQGQIVDSMAEGISLVRPADGIIIYCNPPFERMFGYGPGELVGQHVSVVNAPGAKSPEETVNEIIASLRETESWTGEIHNIKKDGTRFWSHVNITTLQHPDYGQVWVTVKEDITERKRAEEKLRESDARFRAIFEGAGIGMALADMDGRLVESNPTFQRMLGYEAQELRGMVFTDFTHPEDATVDMALYKELEARKRHHYQIEKRYIRKDGQPVWARLTVSLVGGNSAKPQFAIGMVEDITAHKRAEEALRDSEIRFRTTFESAAVAMVLDDEQGRLIETNAAFQKMFGYSAQELEGMTFSELTHPEDVDRGWRLFKELVQGKRDSVHLERRYYRKDRTLLWGAVNVAVIRNGNGSFRHTVAMIQDITAHRLAEDALRASESRFRGLLEAEPDGVVVVDEAGRITLVNTKAAKMFGYRREELFGELVELLVPQPLREKHVGHRAAFLNQPRARPMGTELEVTGRRKDGSEFPADVSLSPLETDEGLFVMSIIRDITQRKRAEQALRFTQFAVDHNSDATYWVRSDGRISYVNHAACQALGYSHQELVSLRVPDIDPDFPDDIWAAHFLKVKEAGSLTFQAHHRTKSGRLFPVEILANYLAYDDQEYLCAYARDITERKRAEEVLRESEERFRVVFESAPFGMVVVDAAGTRPRYNRAFQEMLGYTEQELQERDVAEYTYPEDREDTRRLFAELRQGKRDLYQLEKRYVRKDGRIVWGSLAFTSVRDAQGDVQYLIATVKDITEGKQAEAALRESEERLALALDATSEGLWDWNIATGEVFYSPRWCRALGFDPCEVEPRGRFWNKLVHPEDMPRVKEILNAHFEQKTELYECEVRLRTKSGEYRWNLDRGRVVARDEDGKPVRMIGVDIDITERKRAEEALRESEVKYRELFESASDVICLMNNEGNIVDINRRGELVTGYSRAELCQMNVLDQLVVPEDHAVCKEVLERAAPEAEYVYEVRWRTKQGKIVHFEGASTYQFSASGELMTTRCTLRDITERKRAEEQARQLQADLAHMSRLSSMGEMATGLAHELNQPLTVITNYAQGCVRRLKSNAIDPEELGDILGRIATQAQRSSSIIRGLGNLVRKSSALRFEIDINHCIMEVADLANAEATQHRAKARFELEPNLPLVMADQTQLQQVILNLVQNGCEAIEDTPDSRRAVTVRTKQRGDRELEILVSDNGRGISEPLGERLFEPFFTTKAQGIGMGLAISRSIVESHGGRLWATPNRGKGTTFHFTLPIVGGHGGDE